MSSFVTMKFVLQENICWSKIRKQKTKPKKRPRKSLKKYQYPYIFKTIIGITQINDRNLKKINVEIDN